MDEKLITPMETPPHAGMLWISGGTFQMGSDRHYPEEAPAHHATVDSFWMDTTLVTNLEFRHFVNATGYVTVCEVPPVESQYPGALPELLVAASVVFVPPPGQVGLEDPYQWWQFIAGANWRQPQGPGSTVQGKDNHPVVHIAWPDAEAYAAWSGKEIATEAEWEFAARGGLDGAEYAWGANFTPDGVHQANTWQGKFPSENLEEDGFAGTSPVASFPSNGYGLHDMIGNVWEWTKSSYAQHYLATEVNPCCGSVSRSRDPQQQGSSSDEPVIGIARHVMKGGSHLCAPNYCQRYRPAARMAQNTDTSTSHLGFRCIVRAPS